MSLRRRVHIWACLAVLVAALFASALNAPYALAASVLEAQQDTLAAQAAFDEAKAAYDEAQAKLDASNKALEEAEQKLNDAQEFGWSAIRSEYKIQQYWKNVGVLELLLNSENFSDLLSTLEAQNIINRKTVSQIEELAQAEAELAIAQQNADAALNEARDAHEKAHLALNEAKDAQARAEEEAAAIRAQAQTQATIILDTPAANTQASQSTPASGSGNTAPTNEENTVPSSNENTSQDSPASSSDDTNEDAGSSSSAPSTPARPTTPASDYYSGSYLRRMGVVYWGGYRFTWYSQRVLPGGALRIPGRHVGDEGYVMDGSGRICLASSDLPYGTVVSIPFGNGVGCVYDSGCASGTLDIYVDW